MTQAEYETVAEAICRQIPPLYRREWMAQVGMAVQMASDANLGMRVFEELILRVMIMTGPQKEPSVQQPMKSGMRLV